MRSVLIALVLALSTVNLAFADEVSGKGTGPDQKTACKAAQTQARGTSRKGIDSRTAIAHKPTANSCAP